MMRFIAAVDKNWGIGKDGKLLVSIPNDLKNFKELTMGGTVILGRKTLDTFPGGKPLPGRINIILSKNPKFKVENARVVNSVEEAVEIASALENVWVIGGASIYKAFMPYCDEAVITKINYAYEADSFIENLDESEDWIITDISDEMTSFDLEYRFVTYKRKNNDE